MPQPDATQAAPFPSLAALLAAHAELLQSMPEGRLAEPDVRKVRAFLRQAVASGALIDTPIERKQVQGVLDYWSATLYANSPDRAGETTETTRLANSETVLAEFEPKTIADVAATAETWLQSISQADRDLVRRILLRLVRLSDASRTFLPTPATRAELQQLGTPARVDALLNGLGDAVRIERREHPEDDRISVRFAALTRMWQAYADWLEQRLRFRDTASFWDASSRDSSALIRDELLDESLGYHDKNDIEEAYIVASLNRQREQNTEDRTAKYVFAVVAAVALLLAGLSFSQWSIANQARADEADQRRIAETAARRAVVQEKAAKKAEAALEAKFKLSNMITVTRNLAQVATSNEAERQIALRRMKILVDSLQRDPDFAAVFLQVAKDLADVEQGAASKDVLESIARKALEAGRQLKDRVLAVQDPDLLTELKAERSVAYGMAQFCAEQIVGTFQKQSFEAAEPYIEEFWVLYWGELALLEGPEVESAMVEFGRKLEEIEAKIKAQLSDVGKLVSTSDSSWTSTHELRDKLYALRSKGGMAKDVDQLINQLSEKKVSGPDVDDLRKILKERLIPALRGELDRDLAPSQKLSKDY